jgi:hypothetical protein
LLLVALGFFAALAVFNVAGNLWSSPESQTSTEPVAQPQVSLVRGRVANTDGQGVFVRRSMSFYDRLPTALPEGTVVTVIGAETLSEGLSWRQIQSADGVRGWIPSQYLQVEAPT